MKIALFALNGSYVHSSLALRCLRNSLQAAGYCDVTLMEFSLRDRDAHILESLYAQNADVYGFSVYIWNLEKMLFFAKTLHALLPGTKIVFGGPEVSFAAERFDGFDFIDALICGEGEDAFPALCRKMEEGLPFPRVTDGGVPPVMKNEGILYRDGDATGGILYYESSRGCPYSCAYCLSSATHGVRMKNAEQTLSDMEAFERLSCDCKIIKFVDRTFNADVRRANEIWTGLLDARFTKKYHFEICASLLNEESFEILSRFPKGKIQLECGLQSTNRQTLDASSRHIDPEAVLGAVRRIHAMGNIHVHLDLIAGLPYEGYERFARSFDDAYGSCDLLQLGFLKLLYGTELRAKEKEYGYVSLSTPPYTVLQSKWISYPEICRLQRVAEVLERYVESGNFAHAFFYLDSRMTSPFRFFEGLCDFLAEKDPRPLQKFSQPDAYRYLLEYAAGQSNVCAEELKAMLAADFEAQEHKSAPHFLRPKIESGTQT